jgi:K+-sensing histidine kinase KdpD
VIRPCEKSSSSVLKSEVRRDYIRIDIIDGGPGIVQQQRDGLFRDSGKFDPVDFQSGLGTGMGLWSKSQSMHHGVFYLWIEYACLFLHWN